MQETKHSDWQQLNPTETQAEDSGKQEVVLAKLRDTLAAVEPELSYWEWLTLNDE